VQPPINAAVRKALDHLPTHLRREHSFDDIWIPLRLVETTHCGDAFAFGLHFHRACLEFCTESSLPKQIGTINDSASKLIARPSNADGRLNCPRLYVRRG